jgi:hypothetical protein
VAFWRSEQSRQRHELEEWLRHDSELVAARHATVIASERRFGFDTETPPAVIELPDGRQVRLRGAIDRIDQRADGSLVVTDHKTGSARSFKGITDVDPTAGGTKVQLPAYAAAAIAIAGAPAHTAVTAEYAFMASERFARVSATIGPEGWTTVHHTLARILDGIEAGIFVALPDSSQFRRTWVTCPYCDPDGLGTVERYAEFERKRDDPRLVALFGEAAAEADHD